MEKNTILPLIQQHINTGLMFFKEIDFSVVIITRCFKLSMKKAIF